MVSSPAAVGCRKGFHILEGLQPGKHPVREGSHVGFFGGHHPCSLDGNSARRANGSFERKPLRELDVAEVAGSSRLGGKINHGLSRKAFLPKFQDETEVIPGGLMNRESTLFVCGVAIFGGWALLGVWIPIDGETQNPGCQDFGPYCRVSIGEEDSPEERRNT